MTEDDTRQLLRNNEVKTYRRRWIFLFAIFLLNASSMFSSVCFGLVDDVFTGYFQVGYASADWITLAVYITSCIAIPVLAWFCFTDMMGIRLLVIVESACLTVSYFCIVLAVAFPAWYVFMILGQLIHGISSAIQWSIPPLFAVLWFPNNEVGIAIAANFIGAACGAALGLTLPSYTLKRPYRAIQARHPIQTHLLMNNSTVSLIVNSTSSSNRNWKEIDRDVFLQMFITPLAITFILTIFFMIFLTDLPPKPPTIAQALKREAKEENSLKTENKSFLKFLQVTKNVFSDPIYVLLLVVYSIVHRAVMLEFVMMGELVRAIADYVPIHVKPDVLGSYVMIFYPIFAATGSLTSGKLLDKFRQYRRQSVIGAFMTFVFTFGLAISYYYKLFVVICICNGGFAFSTRICIIALLSVVTRHTFPIDESFVSVWMTGFESIVLIIISEVGRILITFVSDVSVLMFLCVSVFFAFLLAYFTKPRDKRLEAEEEVISHQTEAESSASFQ